MSESVTQLLGAWRAGSREALHALFKRMGFTAVLRHKARPIPRQRDPRDE